MEQNNEQTTPFYAGSEPQPTGQNYSYSQNQPCGRPCPYGYVCPYNQPYVPTQLYAAYPQAQPAAIPQQAQTNVVVNTNESNGIGTAGLVLALLALVFCWVPILDWLLWFLGALFSFLGLFNAPRGAAIAGFIISFIGFIALLLLIGAIGSLASAL